MLNTPFSPWPSFTAAEGDAVRDVLMSNKVNYWTGTQCRSFETEFASWCNTKYAVALSNGTLALDVALKALQISAGDEVIVTPRTFIASVSCVINAGGAPVFADVEPDSGNLSLATISRVVSPRTKAIIVVHLAGWPVDMDPIMDFANARGIKVIEDCAQAHGAIYKCRPVGSIGHIGAWSFCQDKIMTTGGEGGMVTTNDESLWRAMWAYKDHGKSFNAVYEREHAPGFRWLHESFGTNWRMLEMQAVIGRMQLAQMAEWSMIRNRNADAMLDVCRSHAVVSIPEFVCCKGACGANCARQSNCVHARYKCYVNVVPGNLAPGWTRDRIVDEITAKGVPCYQGSCSEVYLEKAFDDTPFRPEQRLPNAKMLGEVSLMFLVHPTLTEDEIAKTCSVLDSVLTSASAQR